jgi:hypothetical protein
LLIDTPANRAPSSEVRYNLRYVFKHCKQELNVREGVDLRDTLVVVPVKPLRFEYDTYHVNPAPIDALISSLLGKVYDTNDNEYSKNAAPYQAERHLVYMSFRARVLLPAP